jgi:hypothetical protein
MTLCKKQKTVPPSLLADLAEVKPHSRSGKPLAATDISEADRKRIRKRIPVGSPDECWEWTGVRLPTGYGNIWLNGSKKRSHRIAYALANGFIPARALVCHSCDNPPCCNPAHLFLGTHKDNVTDCIKKQRHAHGDTHPAVINPGYLRRGDRHPLRERPELIKFGSQSANSKLTEADIPKIRELRACGATQQDIGDIFGVTASNIACVLKGITWSQVK